MTLAKGLLAVAACGLVAHGARTAHAQSAGAEALFREGRALIKQGKLEAGCEKLDASEKLESSVGTLLNLGDCKEKLGKTASAWAAFRKAEAMAKRDGNDRKRQGEAAKRAQKLESQLSNLIIQVGNTNGISLRLDGEALDTGVHNTPIPVDPGAHTVIAEAPGHKPFKTEVSIGKGGKRYVVIPTLEKEPVAVTPPAAAAPVVPPPTATRPSVVVDTPPPEPVYITRTSTWSGTRKVAVGVGVLGAAAVGAGIYFGTRADDLQAESDAICPTTTCGDPEGLRLNDEAQDNALRANILFIAGGAAVATATVMWFVGGPDEERVIAPAVGNGTYGAAFVGRF